MKLKLSFFLLFTTAFIIFSGCSINGNPAQTYTPVQSTSDTTTSQTTTVSTTVTAETTTESAATQTTVTTTQTAVETTEFTFGEQTLFDENDETAMAGLEFAERYAKMLWDYVYGAAWNDYVNIKYFDFDDKSEGNYFEEDGVPYYKLLITDYTYDELMEYIKSFYTDNFFEESSPDINIMTREKDNCIYVNGNEPTFLFPLRNKRAKIVGYVINDDNTVTYNCLSERDSEPYDIHTIDLYFSFTLDDGKLCGATDIDYMYNHMSHTTLLRTFSTEFY